MGEIRIKYVGKKGEITKLIKQIYLLSTKEKITYGKNLNQLLKTINQYILNKRDSIKKNLISKNITNESIDVTIPVYNTHSKGMLHPISQTLHEILHLFYSMGFSIAEGPEIENDFYNFTALNFPIEHPAREEK